MHELSITEGILKLAMEKANEAGAKRITKVSMVIGELSGLVDDCVRFYFEVLAKDTMAAGAEMTFEIRPVTARCGACGVLYTPEEMDWACPSCGKAAAEVTGGRECYMDSIEVD